MLKYKVIINIQKQLLNAHFVPGLVLHSLFAFFSLNTTYNPLK